MELNLDPVRWSRQLLACCTCQHELLRQVCLHGPIELEANAFLEPDESHVHAGILMFRKWGTKIQADVFSLEDAGLKIEDGWSPQLTDVIRPTTTL